MMGLWDAYGKPFDLEEQVGAMLADGHEAESINAQQRGTAIPA